MKYAVFGDIHGNLEALEAVLAAIEKAKPDTLICMGDIVGYGADPEGCLSRMHELGCATVAGNHDFAVVGKLSVDFFNTYAREAALWTRERLRPAQKKLLEDLKLVQFLDEATVVHATLHSPELFEYIQTSYDAHLSFERLSTQICFVGHSHVPVMFFQKKVVTFTMDPQVKLEPGIKTIVNVGSVGQPRDEDARAAYCLYDSEKQTLSIERVEYDIDKAAAKIVAAGLPEILGERLRYGR